MSLYQNRYVTVARAAETFSGIPRASPRTREKRLEAGSALTHRTDALIAIVVATSTDSNASEAVSGEALASPGGGGHARLVDRPLSRPIAARWHRVRIRTPLQQ